MTKTALDAMLKNAEQDGRISSIESKLAEHGGLLTGIFSELKTINLELSSGYAKISHVDESIEKAVQGERLLIRVALWGMGIVFMVVIPILSSLIMNKLNAIDVYMEKNEQFQIRIERHINDTGLHDEIN